MQPLRSHPLRSALISLLLFGLFAEWVRPLAAMSEMTSIHRLLPLLGAIAVYLLLDASRISGWISWPCKVGFTYLWIGYWFQPAWFAGGAWWTRDLAAIADGRWFSLSPELRTFVFLGGWSLLVYAVHRLVTERGQALWFVGATLSFLVLLQLWPGIDTNQGLLIAAAEGLLLLAILHMPTWESATGFPFAGNAVSAAARWTAVAVFGLLAYGAGYTLSAQASQEIEPIPLERLYTWTENIAESAYMSIEGAARTGYGEYDGRLGGPVEADDSVVLEAETERKTYWRGESKDIYTGQGWRTSGRSGVEAVFSGGSGTVQTSGGLLVEQRISVKDPSLAQHIFSGGRIVRFRELIGTDGQQVSDIHVRVSEDTGAYRIGSGAAQLRSYSLAADVPAFNETAPAPTGAPDLSARVSERYLQLPDTLPERVRELALAIVEGVPAEPLQQAAAVQSYLRQHYRYTLETAVPPQGADFADHFLFETKEGYCNHFSTAFVVLMRSLGVEARWVKGFAPGQPDAERPGTYLVRASDAHSWAEVYVSDVGWVPFEATPGFENGYRDALLQPAALTLGSAEPASDGPRAWLEQAVSAAKQAGRETAAAADYFVRKLAEVHPRETVAGLQPWLVWTAVSVPAAIAAPLLWRRLAAKGAPSHAPAALRQLDRFWRRVYRRYGERGPSVTLREYVSGLPVTAPESREALLELIRYDERVRFGGERGRRLAPGWFDEMWQRIAQ